MRISRANYFEFLMDAQDGRLGKEDKKLLEAFMLKHPELQAEWEQVSGVQLKADNISFSWKDALKKDGYTDAELIAYLENELSPEDKNSMSLSFSNQDLRKLELLKKTFLVAENIPFPFKKNLKHKPVLRHIIITTLSAAALVLIFLKLGNNEDTVSIQPAKPIAISIPVPLHDETKEQPVIHQPKKYRNKSSSGTMVKESMILAAASSSLRTIPVEMHEPVYISVSDSITVPKMLAKDEKVTEPEKGPENLKDILLSDKRTDIWSYIELGSKKFSDITGKKFLLAKRGDKLILNTSALSGELPVSNKK